MIIDAIETYYAGINFRSRLEARWAMYFDLLGIVWIYEIDCFKVGQQLYVPDFYLPELKFFCEVKPFEQTDERWEKFVSKQHIHGYDTFLVLLFGKVHCLPYPVMYNGGKRFIGIPHSDSKYAKIYYSLHEKDEKLVEENQQFCNEANSYRFERNRT